MNRLTHYRIENIIAISYEDLWAKANDLNCQFEEENGEKCEIYLFKKPVKVCILRIFVH